MGVFCFAHGQTKNKEDSIVKSITEKVNAVNKRNFGSILILDDSIYSEIKELITPQFFNDRDFLNELVLRLACFAKDDYNGLSRFRL